MSRICCICRLYIDGNEHVSLRIWPIRFSTSGIDLITLDCGQKINPGCSGWFDFVLRAQIGGRKWHSQIEQFRHPTYPSGVFSRRAPRQTSTRWRYWRNSSGALQAKLTCFETWHCCLGGIMLNNVEYLPGAVFQKLEIVVIVVLWEQIRLN